MQISNKSDFCVQDCTGEDPTAQRKVQVGGHREGSSTAGLGPGWSHTARAVKASGLLSEAAKCLGSIALCLELFLEQQRAGVHARDQELIFRL